MTSKLFYFQFSANKCKMAKLDTCFVLSSESSEAIKTVSINHKMCGVTEVLRPK
jgi:hypothetical protein